MALKLPALRFEAEAYQLGTSRILGRQSAGSGFLRGALGLTELTELTGYGPSRSASKAFGQIVAAHRKDMTAKWIAPLASDALRAQGAVHFPDPVIGEHARQRLAAGSAGWSISGITHTISSLGAMRAIADLATAPLMEWDGIVLTSEAVKTSVMELLGAQEDYLAWRFPGAGAQPRPQFPVIPLGVHCDDFAFTDDLRAEARRALGLGEGDVAFLFVGRLSFHAKANPFPMYTALEEVARRTGKRIALIQYGLFANAAIEAAFKQGAQRHAPSVRHIFLDGGQPALGERAWAAGDVFMSLSDNIQESFGLTPLEAMAAGLPVIVTDWNGYRQTVRHGECGLMVPSFAPAPGAGTAYADRHAADLINYDIFLSQTARHVAIDMAALCDAAAELATDAEKRRTMGAAGRRIARAEFDWPVLMRRYREFWAELARIRAAAAGDPRWAPRVSPDRIDPFRLFRNYPTQLIDGATRLRQRTGAGNWQTLLADPLFSQGRDTLPGDAAFAALIDACTNAASPGNGCELAQAAAAAGLGPAAAVLAASLLIKAGVLEVV